MTIVLPHTFKDNVGEKASGVQVDENLETLAKAIEGVTAAAAGTDVYQAGVIEAADWSAGAVNITGGTGKLELTTFGGSAWLPGAVSGLVRTFTTSATVNLTPPSLPASTGWKLYAVELTVSGAEANASIVGGTEQVSEALAVANPPATSSGKMQVLWVPIKNSSGTYSKGTTIDRRPWAVGRVAPQIVNRTASFTAQSGEAALMQNVGVATVTLPAVAANARVAVLVGSASAAVTISGAGGAKIYGDFVSAASSIVVLANQHVVLSCDGTNWLIVSGEPKREGVFTEAMTSRSSGVEYEPSATRPTEVLLTVGVQSTSGEQTRLFKVKLGATVIAEPQFTVQATNQIESATVTFQVPPALKWSATVEGTGTTIFKSSYKLL